MGTGNWERFQQGQQLSRKRKQTSYSYLITKPRKKVNILQEKKKQKKNKHTHTEHDSHRFWQTKDKIIIMFLPRKQAASNLKCAQD